MVSFLTADLDRPVDWSSTLKVMLGLEYSYSDKLDFRVGGSYDQSPAGDEEIATPQAFALGSQMGLGGGFTWHHQQWDFGLAGGYVHQEDVASNKLVDLNNDGIVDSQLVTSVNYRF